VVLDPVDGSVQLRCPGDLASQLTWGVKRWLTAYGCLPGPVASSLPLIIPTRQ
jgi:hypothetical protein